MATDKKYNSLENYNLDRVRYIEDKYSFNQDNKLVSNLLSIDLKSNKV